MEEEPKDMVSNIEYHVVLGDFVTIVEEVPRLTTKRDIDFSINLMPRATVVSKNSYKMSTPELKDLQM
jgi:hypothetical protein